MNMFQEIQLIWRAKRALKRLPKTGDAIADYLEVLEIKGVRKDIGRCPIANYLGNNGIQVMVVTPGAVTLWNTWRTKIKFSPEITAFILSFDSGSYNELVDDDIVSF